MEQQDLLLTTAEIAVAVAGFAALITVLGRLRDENVAVINAIRLRSMIETSFMVIAFCLLPLILNEFSIAPRSIWRVSSAGLALVGGGYSLYRIRVAQAQFGSFLGPTPIFVFFLYAVIAGWELLLAANAYGLFEARTAAVYLAVLYVQLLMAGTFFLRLVASIVIQHKAS